MSDDFELGSVLKFTKYTDLGVYGNDESLEPRVNCATATKPFWAVVTNTGVCYVRYVQGGNEHARIKLGREGPDKWHFEEYPSDFDEWDIIDDPSLWPDKVAAEVARVRLLGVEDDG